MSSYLIEPLDCHVDEALNWRSGALKTETHLSIWMILRWWANDPLCHWSSELKRKQNRARRWPVSSEEPDPTGRRDQIKIPSHSSQHPRRHGDRLLSEVRTSQRVLLVQQKTKQRWIPLDAALSVWECSITMFLGYCRNLQFLLVRVISLYLLNHYLYLTWSRWPICCNQKNKNETMIELHLLSIMLVWNNDEPK